MQYQLTEREIKEAGEHLPAIDPNVLDCVFYVYPDVASAEQNRPAGGTGFLVGVPLETIRRFNLLYAVTNKHCIEGAGPRIILRMNKVSGDFDHLPTKTSEWKPHPDGLDIAARPIELSRDYHYGPQKVAAL